MTLYEPAPVLQVLTRDGGKQTLSITKPGKFSIDGRYLAADEDGVVWLFDLESGAKQRLDRELSWKQPMSVWGWGPANELYFESKGNLYYWNITEQNADLIAAMPLGPGTFAAAHVDGTTAALLWPKDPIESRFALALAVPTEAHKWAIVARVNTVTEWRSSSRREPRRICR